MVDNTMWKSLLETLFRFYTSSPSDQEEAQRHLGALLRLKPASGALKNQAALLLDLMRVELAEQIQRWKQAVGLVLLAFALLICALLFSGALVMLLTWDTEYRLWVAGTVVLAYMVGIGLIWMQLRKLAERNKNAFLAIREELVADATLLKDKLWS